ncbi:hypothetical protein CN514_21160 [Bacillus sp. AFS001701]|uniref:hypothetical protein n=1 Tax=Bacillaceae TaxID=186817 RepID=UPI000BF592AA|nr:hypothetical protein [Bacillus sp. AFS001701]PET45195.1 hypothetical protein CN514_21160 [Bacillus sp. AFS001701]
MKWFSEFTFTITHKYLICCRTSFKLNNINKAWEAVRDQLVISRVNGGIPYIIVQDGDYLKNGELYLMHSYEKTEPDMKYVE